MTGRGASAQTTGRNPFEAAPAVGEQGEPRDA